jgi:3-hydroxyisobutyrate dehydrogenase-like beta-hydroxyacid dehydrogenase
MKRIGLIGVANVGSYYVTKLREVGYPLTVFVRNSQKLEMVVNQGATPVDTVAKVTQNSDSIILALHNSDVVE